MGDAGIGARSWRGGEVGKLSGSPAWDRAWHYSLQKALHHQRENTKYEANNHLNPTGMAIKAQQFPTWRLSPETYLLTSLLHDIGTTSSNLLATPMSFEFYGALLAHNLLLTTHHAPPSLAEAVTEAIIRHQDVGTSGSITELGSLIQFATVFDNMGWYKELVNEETVEDVLERWPRRGWSRCFSEVIRREVGGKPWANTTRLERGEREEFSRGVEENEMGRGWEEREEEKEKEKEGGGDAV